MITLKQTCGACPEQYDAFIEGNDEIAAYLRLRHGNFTVSVPDFGGDLVYQARPEGDGAFIDKEERTFHLNEAVKAIYEKYNIPNSINAYQIVDAWDYDGEWETDNDFLDWLESLSEKNK